ncbi:hypothetical protein REPUB_Repub11eG0005100 [Reevesia pubescens]
MGKTDSSSVLLALVLLIYCFYLQFGTALDTITPSKSIKDPEVIISKTGVFRLGFFSFANSTNRYVGICYNHIPVQTVIWVANRNKPLKDSSGILKISEDGNLVVLNRQEEIVWSSEVTNPVSNTTAMLLDSGNLVLTDNNNGLSIWESFQHLSNAFIATMKVSTDVRTGKKVQLRSWKSPSDPSDGNFSTSLEPLKIPEIIIWKNNRIYSRTGPWNGRIFIGLADMNSVYLDGCYLVADSQEETYYITDSSINKSLVSYRELDSQGKIVKRIWDSGKGNWQQNFRMLRTDCDVYGKCGAFGSCDSTKPSICRCLRGFEPKNREEWNRENWTSGCVRTTPLHCQRANNGSEVGQEDGFLKLEMMKVPAFPDWSSESNGNCEDQCLQSCSCLAYAYDVGIGCMLWSGNLIDMQKFSSHGVDLYIRLASSELDRKKDQSKGFLITTVIVGIIFITTSTFLFWSWMAKHRDPIKKELLDWKKRFNVIEGISRGLLYLHRDSRLRIIHRDLKASNVLLDEELNPKISDFGMARIFGGNENQANTKRVVGTYGYMSPEYAMQGQFSEKSDVFSFGVLLLEIVSGRKNTSFYDNQHSFSLLGYAWKLWEEDNILALADIGVSDSSYHNETLRCIHIGLLCVQEFAKDRPNMSSVVSMLNSEIVDLPTPKQPAFTQRDFTKDAESFLIMQDRFSVNDVTITDFDGR